MGENYEGLDADILLMADVDAGGTSGREITNGSGDLELD